MESREKGNRKRKEQGSTIFKKLSNEQGQGTMLFKIAQNLACFARCLGHSLILQYLHFISTGYVIPVGAIKAD